MALTVVGINHRHAPLDVREKIAYRASEVLDTLDSLLDENARPRGQN